MLRRLTVSIIILLGIVLAVPAIPVVNTVVTPLLGVSEASAQEQRQRKTLFDILFKRRKKKTKVEVKKPPASVRNKTSTSNAKKTVTRKTTQKTKTATRKTTGTNRNVAKVPEPAVVVAKNENAAKILVFGDFLAGGMARELEKRFAENPDIVIIESSDPSSGLVRDDVVNWPQKVPELLDEFKPIAVVSLVGMNDRQKMWSVDGKPEKLSPDWLSEYNTRIEAITSAISSRSIPLVWMGLPPVRSSSMNSDYLAFNELYRAKVELSTGASYLDIWNGFTNEDGKFVSAGPDINGQIVRLRGQKGINMTRAGRAKLAFFAEKELRRLGIIDNATNAAFAGLGTINLNGAQPSAPEYDPAETGRTTVISLGSPALDGGITLDGEKPDPDQKENDTSVSFKLVRKGQNLEPKVGRIDSSWGKPQELEIIKPEEADKDKKKTSSLLNPAAQNTNTQDTNKQVSVINTQPAVAN